MNHYDSLSSASLAAHAGATVINVEAFEVQLIENVSAIVRDYRNSLRENNLPIKASADKLTGRFRSLLLESYHIVSDHNEVAAEELSNPDLGTFIRLPRELRDDIFTTLIRDGDVALTEVSKIIRFEIALILFKFGVCRLYMNFNRKLPLLIPESIQNLHIRIRTKYNFIEWRQDLDILRRFPGSQTQRNSCHVIFENKIFQSKMVCNEVLQVLQNYIGLELVAVTVMTDRGRRDLKEYPPIRKGVYDYITQAYDLIYYFLSPTLGYAEHDWINEEMVFYPSRYLVAPDIINKGRNSPTPSEVENRLEKHTATSERLDRGWTESDEER